MTKNTRALTEQETTRMRRQSARIRTVLYALASLALATVVCFADGPGGIWWPILLFICSALLADAADLADSTRRHPVRTSPGTIRRDRLGVLLSRAERGALAEGEVAVLRQLVAAEIHEGEQARIQAATEKDRADRAEAAICDALNGTHR
ncbi:hypothetical protein ACFVWX_29070 [Streptomyces sp. NPDC058220]|uniref:hypothetical protein n=1 Tax=Streptomyces sp. NPDC058220 TaxID=3346387 RepID=UPI0036E00A10